MSRRPFGWVFGLLLMTSAAGAADPPGREDLALGKPATASASQDESRGPAMGNDGDPQTRWCPPDDKPGHWWQVDLGRPETLTGCRVVWEFDGAGYRYKVEGSPDGNSWSVLTDQTSGRDHSQERRHDLRASGVRHVRLTVTGLDPGRWGSFYEFEVFGTKPAAATRARKPGAGLLAKVKAPAGWKVTLFAAPPDVRYPTCLAAAATGEVFVGIDENGSLDAKGQRGRVVRCVDTDDDGVADRFTDFAVMDSPRGLAHDGETLYVLHPPDLTAYRDTDGDGKADRTEVLVKGIGRDLAFRGADHTTNGIRLGIDGFLYVAVGDYGFTRAVGKDGTAAQLRGGGIARVRTDGTGLEVYSRGQRNIYDVAVDPLLNVFTRDNTNDGGGWDVRLSHVIPTAQMGYPSLFTNFGDEIVPPLADYGGGSPCGSLYLQEPGFPAGFGDTLYTCEWGRSRVDRHPLTPNGAGFKAGLEPFLDIPRPTDIDVDGRGRLFVSNWSEGGFTYSGPNVGFVVRVTPPGPARPPFPDLKKASDADLVSGIASDTAVMRLAAQRELLRRGRHHGAQGLYDLILTGKPLGERVAALFTYAQLRGADAIRILSSASEGTVGTDGVRRTDLRAFALRALSDRKADAAAIPAKPFVDGLTDPDPRVRLEAVVGLGRLGKAEAAAGVVKLTADPDPLVAHAAVNALVALHAVDACLAALDPARPSLAPGAARALQAMHDPRAVHGLIVKLSGAKDDSIRRPVLKALCRLYHREAEWTGDWWGTRPDTSGPYYRGEPWSETEAIGQALRSALGAADPAGARWLLGELLRNKVDLEGSTALAVKAAGDDPAFRAAVVAAFAGRPRLSSEAVDFLGSVAASGSEPPALRARALRGLTRDAGNDRARATAARALGAVAALDDPPGELAGVLQDFARDGRNARHVAEFLKMAEGPDLGRGVVGYAVLLQAAAGTGGGRRRAQAESSFIKEKVAHALDRPETKVRLLRAVALLRDKTWAPTVTARLDDPDPAVRQAATRAAAALGIGRPAAGQGPGQGPVVSKLPWESVVADVQKAKGDAGLGARLFERQGCINCHTVSKSEPAKGPYLGDIANRYSRKELAESILKPSAKIAQGFETQKFATADGRTLEGFVVRESGDEVEVRNNTGAVTVIPKADIEERARSEVSVMPTGLADPLTVNELASILAYLESLKARAGQ